MDNNFPLLIVGLGNPGIEYEKTRHNIGAFVAYYYAQRYSIAFKQMKNLDGFVGVGAIEGRKVIFLLPTTYMNLSGRAVRKCVEYYNIPLSNLLVLCDDTYLNFSDVRFKIGGSSGGHNGLKDIENMFGTKDYLRLRIGIGEKTTEDLADYVLQNFTKDELSKLDDIVEKCIIEIQKNILTQQEDKQNEDLRRN